MNPKALIGAAILGIGSGLLLDKLFPVGWFWPFGLILAGLLFWRQTASWSLRTALLTASLVLALQGLEALVFSGQNALLARFESTAEQEQTWQAVEHVEVLNSTGDIVLQGGNSLHLKVSYHGSKRGAKPPAALQVDYDSSSRTLTIKGVNPTWPLQQRRELSAELELFLPEGVSLKVHNKLGDIQASSFAEAILSTDIGQISTKDIAGKLVIKSDVGSIEVAASGAAELQTRVGSIALSCEEPVAQPLSLKTDLGNISIALPAESNVMIQAHSKLRQFKGDLERLTATEAQLRLGAGEYPVRLEANVGEVLVRQR
jgi:DUF4097 and DUF4098 domain-containing protein YvlB